MTADHHPTAAVESAGGSRPVISYPPHWGQTVSSLQPGPARGLSPQPVAWGALQSLRAGDTEGVQTCGPPAGSDLATVQAQDGTNIWRAGWTYFPTGYAAPDFEFNAKATGANWTAQPTLKTAASDGSGNSYYVSAGKYKTQHVEAGKDVYWNFSAAISTRDQAAEQEHCDDTALAYDISLKEAETLLNTHIVGKSFGPKSSKAAAEQLVLDEITAKLTHAGLGNDKTKWASIYDTLFRKTLTRDTSGWHTFALGARTVDAAGNITYEMANGTTKVGTVSSATIIKY
jgi:hypothetical protein